MAAEVVELNACPREGRRPRELARSLNIAPAIVYQAVACGEFGPVWRFGKSGKAIVIPESAVQAWLASKQDTGGPIAA